MNKKMTQDPGIEILDFNSPERLVTPGRAGGKFYHLYRLHRSGRFHVPRAFCLPSRNFSKAAVLKRVRADR